LQRKGSPMRRRQAFTLVELLVSMALIIFIMAILTEAFSAGLTTFRQLKAIGDMQERMRSVAILLRRDLQADHFQDIRGNRLSDIDLRPTNSTGLANPNPGPPQAGYFRIWQQWQGGTDPRTWCSVSEGNEAIPGSGVMPSTRCPQSSSQTTVNTVQYMAF